MVCFLSDPMQGNSNTTAEDDGGGTTLSPAQKAMLAKKSQMALPRTNSLNVAPYSSSRNGPNLAYSSSLQSNFAGQYGMQPSYSKSNFL